MNYIVLNGKRSSLIKGLLIQSLPPISKPMMRSSIEEIDGRDGDIITRLGYSAYDKTVSVGLYGNYNVDEVIQFFDTEGIVIFSNEPDKFYKFQVLEQIDFERLIRFKTATVTFHVQPFKYSAVDDVFKFSQNELEFRPFEKTENGITVKNINGLLRVTGTATQGTEIYVPITPMRLGTREYILSVVNDGNINGEIRVCGTVATNADSFGGAPLNLSSSVVEMISTLHTPKTFNYVWLYIPTGTTVDSSINVRMLNDIESFDIVNRGNTVSRPIFTIYGTGTITLNVNGSDLITLTMGNAGYITIDSAEMEAYKGDTLMNRSVSGDYDKLVLKQGTNHVTWTGDLTKIEIERYSRWI